jgi:hypothetical protein
VDILLIEGYCENYNNYLDNNYYIDDLEDNLNIIGAFDYF